VAEPASTPIDALLVKELGNQGASLVLPLLQRLAELLSPEQPGTIRASDPLAPWQQTSSPPDLSSARSPCSLSAISSALLCWLVPFCF
jgi:hypothetical protein